MSNHASVAPNAYVDGPIRSPIQLTPNLATNQSKFEIISPNINAQILFHHCYGKAPQLDVMG
jgi:hypothetical protein